jgi:hypothetical protein
VKLDGASRRLLSGLANVEFPARLSVPLARAIVELTRRRPAPTEVPDPALGAVLAGHAKAARSKHRVVSPRPRSGRPLRARHALVVGVALLGVSGAATASSVWLAPAGNSLYGFNPGIAVGAPPAVQLGALAVLRRPQAAGDRGNSVQAALADVNNFTLGLRSDYVRVLATTANGPVVLAPVERRDAAAVSSASAIADALCVYYPVSRASALNDIAHCWSTQQLLAGQAFASVGDHEYGLVPDGVRAVRVSIGAWQRTVPVADNFFGLMLPQGGSTAAPLGAVPVAPTVTLVRDAG